MREGECPYGKKCKYSHDVGHQELKKSGKGEKVYIDASYDDYQGLERSPERKKGRFDKLYYSYEQFLKIIT